MLINNTQRTMHVIKLISITVIRMQISFRRFTEDAATRRYLWLEFSKSMSLSLGWTSVKKAINICYLFLIGYTLQGKKKSGLSRINAFVGTFDSHLVVPSSGVTMGHAGDYTANINQNFGGLEKYIELVNKGGKSQ